MKNSYFKQIPEEVCCYQKKEDLNLLDYLSFARLIKNTIVLFHLHCFTVSKDLGQKMSSVFISTSPRKINKSC